MKKGNAAFKGSESALAGYFDRIGWSWQYEAAHGRLKPDFTILDEELNARAVIELEDCCATKLDLEMRREMLGRGSACRGYDPYKHIRRAIKNGSKQFKGVATNLPCMLVVADVLGKPSCDWTVLGAMFGDICIQVPLGETMARESKNIFGGGGKMLEAPNVGRGSLYLKENLKIGAVAYLKAKPVRAILAGLKSDLRWISDHFTDNSEEMLLAMSQCYRNYEAQGISEHEVEPCLEIYVNPVSTLPWPIDLHGPFDQVWAHNPETLVFEKVFDGLLEPPPKPIRRSQTQLDIEALMADPMLRTT